MRKLSSLMSILSINFVTTLSNVIFVSTAILLLIEFFSEM